MSGICSAHKHRQIGCRQCESENVGINQAIEKLEKINNLLWHTRGIEGDDRDWIREAAVKTNEALAILRGIERVTGTEARQKYHKSLVESFNETNKWRIFSDELNKRIWGK